MTGRRPAPTRGRRGRGRRRARTTWAYGAFITFLTKPAYAGVEIAAPNSQAGAGVRTAHSSRDSGGKRDRDSTGPSAIAGSASRGGGFGLDARHRDRGR